MTHTLKIWPGSYDAVASGAKTHEIRQCSDRNFNAGDMVYFREWVPDETEKVEWEGLSVGYVTHGHYTGRQLWRSITYVSAAGSWGLPKDICVFSMK